MSNQPSQQLFDQEQSQEPSNIQPADQPQEIKEPHPIDNIVCVQLRKKYGSLFPGEIGGYPSHIAAGLIKTGGAYPLDENRQPIIPAAEVKPHPVPVLSNIIEPDGDDNENQAGQPSRKPRRKKADNASNNESPNSEGESSVKPTIVADELIKPFLADGIQRDEASALYNAGLQTPEDVTNALSIGRDLEEIKGIGPKTFADLKLLYGE